MDISAGDHIVIDQKSYVFRPHPSVPDMAFGQEGRKAIVYQLGLNSSLFALKIFKTRFRDPALVDTCNNLSQLNLKGLDVCTRECFSPATHQTFLRRYPEMEYAVLMPWILGATWFDVVVRRTAISKDSSKVIARNTADVLVNLEKRGYAHCDVAAANVIVNTTNGDINFIDVEDMFGPMLPPPNSFPKGSEGYQHKTLKPPSTGHQWCAEGDRFSAAVLLAEMLAWHDLDIRNHADDEHYFDVKEMQDPQCERYRILMRVLRGFSDQIGDLFERVWLSQDLADCPTLSEWDDALQFPLVSAWTPIEQPAPAAAFQITWEPLVIPESKGMPVEFTTFTSLPITIASDIPKAPAFFRRDNAGLKWYPSDGAEGYIVHESDEDGFLSPRVVYKGPDAKFLMAEEPTSMYYRVCAYNSFGSSPWSQSIHDR